MRDTGPANSPTHPEKVVRRPVNAKSKIRGCVKFSRSPGWAEKGPPPNGNSSSKNAVERNPFPLGETKNTPNNYSSMSLLIHERASNNTTVRLVFGRFIFRYAGA